MKKILLTILVLFFAVGMVSARHHKHKKKKSKAKATVSIQSVTMHRTACFGRCPDYTIKIDNDGLVTYTGIHFTTDSGAYEKNIGIKEANNILGQFAAYRVDTCQEEYHNMIPDAPGLLFIIKYKDKTQNIYNAHFGPPFLKELAKSMDAVAKVDDSWKKITPGGNK